MVGERGQAATEYMLVIAVIVIAVVSAAYTFLPGLQAGVNRLSRDVDQMLDFDGVSIAKDLLNHQAGPRNPREAARRMDPSHLPDFGDLQLNPMTPLDPPQGMLVRKSAAAIERELIELLENDDLDLDKKLRLDQILKEPQDSISLNDAGTIIS